MIWQYYSCVEIFGGEWGLALSFVLISLISFLVGRKYQMKIQKLDAFSEDEE